MQYTSVHPIQISQAMSEGNSYILVLATDDGSREVPIVIGDSEAQALIMAVEGEVAKRPLTHNLISTLFKEYMLTLKRVTIDRFEEGIFYATLHISDGFSEKRIDSRTSDAIILATLQGAEMMIGNDVLEETSMPPGALFDNLPGNRGRTAAGAPNAVTIEALEELLRECEEEENYERAQEVMEQIEALKRGMK